MFYLKCFEKKKVRKWLKLNESCTLSSVLILERALAGCIPSVGELEMSPLQKSKLRVSVLMSPWEQMGSSFCVCSKIELGMLEHFIGIRLTAKKRFL